MAQLVPVGIGKIIQKTNLYICSATFDHETNDRDTYCPWRFFVQETDLIVKTSVLYVCEYADNVFSDYM